MPTTTTALLIGFTVSTTAAATTTATTGQQRPESSSFSLPPWIAPGTCQRGRDTATTFPRTRALSRMMKRRTRRKRRTSQGLVEEDEETGGGAERRDAPSWPKSKRWTLNAPLLSVHRWFKYGPPHPNKKNNTFLFLICRLRRSPQIKKKQKNLKHLLRSKVSLKNSA